MNAALGFLGPPTAKTAHACLEGHVGRRLVRKNDPPDRSCAAAGSQPFGLVDPSHLTHPSHWPPRCVRSLQHGNRSDDRQTTHAPPTCRFEAESKAPSFQIVSQHFPNLERRCSRSHRIRQTERLGLSGRGGRGGVWGLQWRPVCSQAIHMVTCHKHRELIGSPTIYVTFEAGPT
jgi:hypothetical protein